MGGAWTLGLIAATAYGISIGSFLNVVIWRVPRGQSIDSPRWSYCPNCQHRLGGWDLVPLFSFLFLGAKCRYCHEPISWRYPIVESLTGVLFAVVFLVYGLSADTVFNCLFVAVLVAVFATDVDLFLIPDELSACAVGIGIAHNVWNILHRVPDQWTVLGACRIPSSIVALAVCALIFNVISVLGYTVYQSRDGKPPLKGLLALLREMLDDYAYVVLRFTGAMYVSPATRRFVKERSSAEQLVPADRQEIIDEIENDDEQTGMGHGDAKLAAGIGANLLLTYSLVGFFVSIFIGGLYGVVQLLLLRKKGRTAVPFGPFLVVGAIVALLVGHPLLSAYMRFEFPVK